MNLKMKFLCILSLIFSMTTYADYNVTNNNDSGAGSLRQAIIDNNAAADNITFTFIDANNIDLLSPLPAINNATTISYGDSNPKVVDGGNLGNLAINADVIIDKLSFVNMNLVANTDVFELKDYTATYVVTSELQGSLDSGFFITDSIVDYATNSIDNSFKGKINLKRADLTIDKDGNLGDSDNSIDILADAPGDTTIIRTTETTTISRDVTLSSSPKLELGVDANKTLTIDNDISGDGDIEKTDAGTLILSGENSGSWDLTISTGEVKANVDSFPADVDNNATLTLDQSEDGEMTGVVTGTGTLNKNGSGTFVVTGVNTQAIVNVNEGAMQVDDSLTATTKVEVAADGVLQGTGTVTTPTCTIKGILRPGNSIGDFNVVGNLELDSTSTLENEVFSTATDLTNVTGNVIINSGATFRVIPLGGSYQAVNNYTVIDYGGSRTGTFTRVLTDAPMLQPLLVYNDAGTEINLVLTLQNFANIGLSGNAQKVGSYLDGLNPQAGSDLDNILQLLYVLNQSELQDALDQMHSAPFKGFALAEENNGFNATRSISSRLSELYKTKCNKTICEREKSNMWINPYGSFYYQRGYSYLVGFDARGGGITLGYDYGFENDFYIGGAAGYSYTDIDWNRSRGKGDINSIYMGVYSLWHSDYFFIDSSILGGYNMYKAQRNIEFSTIDRKANSSHDGGELIMHVKTGGIFDTSSFEVMPFVSLDYIFLHEDGYTEKGADSLNLKVNSENYNTIRTELGFNFAKCSMFSTNYFIPEMGISWVYESRIDGKYYTNYFEGESSSFKVRGMQPSRSFVSPSLTLSWLVFNKDGIISLSYHGEYGKDTDNHMAGASFIWHF